MREKGRIFGLDLLRAYAIFSIMIGHGTPLLPDAIKIINPVIAWNGVALFFVLNGYLIGGIIIKKFNLKEFSIRRWFRTLPYYFLILPLLILIYQPTLKSFLPPSSSKISLVLLQICFLSRGVFALKSGFTYCFLFLSCN